MSLTIPPRKAVAMRAVLPDGMTTWPGPPAWTPSDPDHVLLVLTHDSQMRAELTVYDVSGVTVTIECGELRGTSETIDTNPNAAVPDVPIEIVLA